MARVFKAKYFPKTSLLKATAKTNSSYAWKSIIHGTQLISHGLKYIVGNRAQIEVWNDNWLPLNPPKPLSEPGAYMFPHLKVSDLLYQGNWNEELLHCIMNQEDASHIRNIRPTITRSPDVISWMHTKDGVYTVKSGYHLQHKLSHDASLLVNSVQNHIASNTFSKIWNQQVPQKIKHFWWKCLHNALPTAENLKKRRILRDDNCQRCVEAIESTNHLLFQCRVSQEIWSLSLGSFHSGTSPFSNSVHQNVDFLLSFNNHQRKDVSISPFIGWHIWKARNDLLFKNKKLSIPDIINKAFMDLQQWKDSLLSNQEKTETGKSQKGEKQVFTKSVSKGELNLKANEYYCFVDGSWVSPTEIAGIGWVLYTANHKVFLQGSASINPTNTPLEVEAEALRSAVSHVVRLGYNNVKFCGDASTLFQKLGYVMEKEQKCQNEHSFLATYLQDIMYLSHTYANISFVKISCNVNTTADKLAKEARIAKSGYVISWL
ncbi:PREDICTED: uncharacterized protein LOC104728868 [Camelina sativa]|uniref:Uncharacterized protein LOC104728868 n=1 Tax=Camelina sativa TaxID=90675 RepID=A0ABM0UTI0_CAMSA|nr:PREDICTED: uncharacterized protein LOC104728868 [Camelina sativa]